MDLAVDHSEHVNPHPEVDSTDRSYSCDESPGVPANGAGDPITNRVPGYGWNGGVPLDANPHRSNRGFGSEVGTCCVGLPSDNRRAVLAVGRSSTGPRGDEAKRSNTEQGLCGGPINGVGSSYVPTRGVHLKAGLVYEVDPLRRKLDADGASRLVSRGCRAHLYLHRLDVVRLSSRCSFNPQGDHNEHSTSRSRC